MSTGFGDDISELLALEHCFISASPLPRNVLLQRAGAAAAAAGAAAAGGVIVLCDDAVHTVEYDWPHSGFLSSFDHAA